MSHLIHAVVLSCLVLVQSGDAAKFNLDVQAGPLPTGESKSLQAVIMEVTGNARWRASSDSPWKTAAVNDILDSGAEIRTATRSSVGLRVGKNATVLVESASSFIIPEVVQEGSTLRTRAAIKSGRANFKVDEIGLTNDFQVITPSMALAVRGTGFAVEWGGLSGVSVEGLPANRIAAMELRYFLTNLSYFVGDGNSSDTSPDPAESAWGDTVGISTLLGQIGSSDEFQQLLENGFALFGNYFEQKGVQNGFAGLNQTFEVAGGPGTPPPGNPYDPRFDPVAFGYLCENLGDFMATFISELAYEADLADYPLDKDDIKAVSGTYAQLVQLCYDFFNNNPNIPSNPMQEFSTKMNAYCNSLSQPVQTSICLQLANDLMVEFSQPYNQKN